MTKLCPRGKAAAKRKFAVYPSAYANAYASKICAGKIKDPSGVKRKDFKGPKPAGKAEGGRIGYKGGNKAIQNVMKAAARDMQKTGRGKEFRKNTFVDSKTNRIVPDTKRNRKRYEVAGGGLMEATARLKRQGLKSGAVARGCGAIMANRKKKTRMV